MRTNLSLRDATVQEIQLELLRRTSHNALNGEKVYASLTKHRELWRSALLDRPGVADYTAPRTLFMLGLIKLRDLPHNDWNADTLFILTDTMAKAKKMARIAKEESWAGEIRLYENRQEMDRALGGYDDEYGLLSIWWD